MRKSRLFVFLFLVGLLLIPGTPSQSFLPLETALFENQNINTLFYMKIVPF